MYPITDEKDFEDSSLPLCPHLIQALMNHPVGFILSLKGGPVIANLEVHPELPSLTASQTTAISYSTTAVASCLVLLCPNWPSCWLQGRIFCILKYECDHSLVHNPFLAAHLLERNLDSSPSLQAPEPSALTTLCLGLFCLAHLVRPHMWIFLPLPSPPLALTLPGMLFPQSFKHHVSSSFSFLLKCHLLREAFLSHTTGTSLWSTLGSP